MVLSPDTGPERTVETYRMSTCNTTSRTPVMENHIVTVNLCYVKSCSAAIVLDKMNIVDYEETNANAGIRVRPNYAPWK